jgi:hypothetical protein
MPSFLIALLIVATVFLLLGIIGRGVEAGSGTFTVKVEGKVGPFPRIIFVIFSAINYVAALVLFIVLIGLSKPTQPPASGPATIPVAATTPVTPASSPSSDASNVLATGTVQIPQGYSTVNVYQQPSLSSSVVAQVANGATIDILCTTQGDVVTNSGTGQSSSLWDGTSDGYIPDVYIDTGTNQATMGSC